MSESGAADDELIAAHYPPLALRRSGSSTKTPRRLELVFDLPCVPTQVFDEHGVAGKLGVLGSRERGAAHVEQPGKPGNVIHRCLLDASGEPSLRRALENALEQTVNQGDHDLRHGQHKNAADDEGSRGKREILKL